eukprot:3481557-Prymnesium_polylepis.2
MATLARTAVRARGNSSGHTPARHGLWSESARTINQASIKPTSFRSAASAATISSNVTLPFRSVS